MKSYGWSRPTKISHTVLHDIYVCFLLYVYMCYAIYVIYYALYIHDTTRYIIQFANDMIFSSEMILWRFFYCLWNANVMLLFIAKNSTINWTTIVGFPRLFFTARGSTRLLVKSVSGSVLAQIKVVEVCLSFSAGHLLNVQGLSLCWFRVIGHYCFRVFPWLYMFNFPTEQKLQRTRHMYRIVKQVTCRLTLSPFHIDFMS